MRRIFGLGETVLDVLFKDDQPLSAKAGGSVLNALVSLARMGHACYFISELGNDKVGQIITQFLHQNKVNTDYVQRYSEGQSALAMAFLNKNNDASYEFYKNYPKERLTGALPTFKKDDILLFGSSYAITPTIRPQVRQIVEQANKQGCILLYDPNFRKKHDANKELYLQYIGENIEWASLVRGSNEDFENIYQTHSCSQTFQNISQQCHHLIYTAQSQGVYTQNHLGQKHYPVPNLKPISTIGAGDNFNAGMIHGIILQHITRLQLASLNEKSWDFLIQQGIEFSAEVCKSQDNYVPDNFRSKGDPSAEDNHQNAQPFSFFERYENLLPDTEKDTPRNTSAD